MILKGAASRNSYKNKSEIDNDDHKNGVGCAVDVAVNAVNGGHKFGGQKRHSSSGTGHGSNL